MTAGHSWYLLQIIELAINIILKLEIFIKILSIYRVNQQLAFYRIEIPRI